MRRLEHAVLTWYPLLLFVVSVCLLAITAQYVRDSNAQTHSALCSFRRDLSDRVQSSSSFLAVHHEAHIKIGSLTVDRSTLVTQLMNQRRTLDSLDALHCKE